MERDKRLREMDELKKKLKGRVKRSAFSFLESEFKRKGLTPCVESISLITEEELFDSWLSIHSVKEILLIQQENRI